MKNKDNLPLSSLTDFLHRYAPTARAPAVADFGGVQGQGGQCSRRACTQRRDQGGQRAMCRGGSTMGGAQGQEHGGRCAGVGAA
jgi:hypothetical protein